MQIEQQLRSQQEEITALEGQIAGLDATAVDVQPCCNACSTISWSSFERCAFFKQERDQRIGGYGDHASVDATPSEKFRRLMEAYQIEMEYGRTMSAYRKH